MESNIQKNEVKLPPQLTGAKYKYSCRLDKPVQTKDDYIEELERQVCEKEDRIRYEVDQWYHHYIPERLKWKMRALKAEAELKMIKKFLEKAKRATNQQFDEDSK